MRVRRSGPGSGRGPVRALAAVLLGATLALAGCSGASDSGNSSGADKADGGAQREAGAGSAAEDKGRKGAEQPAKLPGEHIIRTARLSIEVKSTSRALARIRTVAADAGGFVADETVDGEGAVAGDGGGPVTANVVLRVPQEEFAATLKDLEGAGKLTHRDVKAKDVTEQMVDVESRIKTQRVSVVRVRELMDKATKLSDVVTLESELSRRQANLEALLAKQASLKDRTSMSTITLDVEQPSKEQREQDGEPGFLDALGGGWDVFVTIVKWIALAIAAALPFLALAALLYAVWRLIARRLPKRPATAPQPGFAHSRPVPTPPAGSAAGPAAPESGPERN